VAIVNDQERVVLTHPPVIPAFSIVMTMACGPSLLSNPKRKTITKELNGYYKYYTFSTQI
jgi:hypothetical protein